MYYGWFIVSGALLSQLAIVGFYTYVFSLLVIPLQTTFDASRTEVMACMSASTILGLFLAPVIGLMADKYPVRWLMTAGAAIFGGGLFLLSMSQTLLQFTLIFALVMALSNQLLGPLCGSVTISRWFSDNRGKALGLAATGSSLGGMLLPALFIVWLGDNGDWRNALQNLSYGVLLILFPYLLVFMRDANEAEQADLTNNSDKTEEQQNDFSFKDIVKHPAYWVIAVSLALLFSSYSALLANLTPYLSGLGVEKESAGQSIMMLAIAGLAGKLLFGYAADRINLRLALSVTQIAVLASLIVLAIEPSFAIISAAIILLGIATGGMLPVWGALLAAIFGTASYGKVMGLMMPLIVLIVMPGYALAGYLYDQTGGYSSCFYIFSIAIALSMPLIVLLKLPAANETVTPAT